MSMDERSDVEKGDEIMLPGFRFHPTDEELVGFYLKRKIQQKPLSIELIRQLDIYKYDPWDLPKLATTGEKEWYFYCPRDRKYRNSARPNRVTGAGFWKATGTDRPIYSSEGTKCIGLKKSLVFYKGRAAKGVKTDWMMHEFRLPSLTDSSLPKRPLDKDIPPNDSWAICRIFKKTNSMAQRALSHSWVSQLPENNESDMFSVSQAAQISPQFNPQIAQCTTEVRPPAFQFSCNSNLQQQCNTISYPPLDLPPYKHINQMINCKQSLLPVTSPEVLPPNGFMISPSELQVLSKCNLDVASMLLNLSPAVLGDVHDKASASIDFGQQQQQQQQQQCVNPFPGAVIDLPLVEVSSCLGANGATAPAGVCTKKSTENACGFGDNMNSTHWGAGKAVAGFPFGHPPNFSDEWKANILLWDSPAPPPCPGEISTSYNSCTTTTTINNNNDNKCYT